MTLSTDKFESALHHSWLLIKLQTGCSLPRDACVSGHCLLGELYWETDIIYYYRLAGYIKNSLRTTLILMSCGPGGMAGQTDIPAIYRDIMVICVHTDRQTFHDYYCLCTMPKKDHPSHCCSGILQCTVESVVRGHLSSTDK